MIDFEKTFEALTGNPPFPWQTELHRRFLADREDNIPQIANLPTGLGKTSVIAVWLLALVENDSKMPRRLVYVVNRRTVVDQTTTEVTALRNRLNEPDKYAVDPSHVPILQCLADTLRSHFTPTSETPLAISTLRGQFADNQEWSVDPSRPAVICGTVDMIGSRLLFEGYRIGFKSRPLHAGFLGQDSLLVHDEAHLEPAFQHLVESIQKEQAKERERNGKLPWLGLRVMALSATVRGDAAKRETVNCKPFELTDEEKQPPEMVPDPPTEPIHDVWRRLKAKKSLHLHPCEDEKKLAKLADQIAGLAAKHEDHKAAVLVFVRKVGDVAKVVDGLKKKDVTADSIETLTGTMRGYERDQLVGHWIMKCFLREACPLHTVYLVCTSAGEVGVNLSADHMVCDLSTFDSMAQRFGRVNRFGDRNDTRVDVVYPKEFGGKGTNAELEARRKKTLDLLKQLNGDASPKALGKLLMDDRLAAFSPEPTILPATDILFDAWAMTTIKGKMPGRPPVAPYLHGIAEWEPPRTSVAWRDEVAFITKDLIERNGKEFPQSLLEDYLLKPHELLNDLSERVYAALQEVQKRLKKSGKTSSIWIVDQQGEVTHRNLEKWLEGDKKRAIGQISGCTLLLPPSVGGLAGGMLDGASDQADDVADITDGPNQRIRIHPDDSDYEAKMAKAADMRRVRSIELPAADDIDNEPRRWEWYEGTPLEGGRTAKKPVMWKTHVDDVVSNAKHIIAGLSLPPEITRVIVVAAELHDHGKRRERFQITLGNRAYPDVLWAKSGKKGARLPEPFRHEFASVLDALADDEFNKLDDEMKDLVLHLISAHHGRARPHFRLDEAFDPERPSSEAEALMMETPRRFARLQRRYGRWGLAYLESLLRAADWAASAAPSAYVEEPEGMS